MNQIQKEIKGSGIRLSLKGEELIIQGPTGSHRLKMVPLHRPSSTDVLQAASSEAVLVMSGVTQKAALAAAPYNHILVPDGGYRILAPGVALYHSAELSQESSRQARLSGRSGVIVESLLLGGKKAWSVQELAKASYVSASLVHRVLARLEEEGLLIAEGRGPAKRREVTNRRALAELWSQEEKQPEVVLRGYLYARSIEALATKLLERVPKGATGGVLAANLYKPILTRVPPPVRIWVPESFSVDCLEGMDFQKTGEGFNIEFIESKEDPWQVHRTLEGLARVSAWRAWLEIAHLEGRIGELADALLNDLLAN